MSDADPQAGMHAPFPAVVVDGLVTHKQSVELGNVRLTPYYTPGHSPGALSWQWQSCDRATCLTIVYADSLSAVSSDQYRFSEHLGYVRAFRAGIATLVPLECDIVLAPHPSAARMRTRMQQPTGLVDTTGCTTYAHGVRKKLEDRIVREQLNKQEAEK